MGQIARKRERWRKKEAVLGKNIAPRMETLFPQEQFLLVARGKEREYPASLLSLQRKPF